MRQAVESARMGWGLATVCGVAGKGETLDVVPRYLITGPPGRRLVVRRRQRPRPGAAARRPLARRARSTSSRSISHRLALDEVNRGFELMEAQDGIRSVIVFDS